MTQKKYRELPEPDKIVLPPELKEMAYLLCHRIHDRKFELPLTRTKREKACLEREIRAYLDCIVLIFQAALPQTYTGSREGVYDTWSDGPALAKAETFYKHWKKEGCLYTPRPFLPENTPWSQEEDS